MYFQNYWNILGIEPTTNKDEIKKAYAQQVKKFHPEEQPEKFKQLQNAYKSAMAYADFQIQHKEVVSLDEDIQFPNDNPKLESTVYVETNEAKTNVYFEGKQEDKDLVQSSSKKQDDAQVLEKIKMFLDENQTIASINEILSNALVLRLFSNSSFKNEVEQILLNNLSKMDNPTLRYLENISDYYGFHDLHKQVDKRLKFRYKWIGAPKDSLEYSEKESKRNTIIKFLLFFLVMSFLFRILFLRANKSNQEIPSNPIRDTIVDTTTAEVENLLYIEKNKEFEEYLYGLHVIKGDEGFRIVDESEVVLFEQVFSRVLFTTTKYLILYENEMVYILDCETRTFQVEPSVDFMEATTKEVVVDNQLYTCAILSSTGGQDYILLADGRLLEIDASFGYDASTFTRLVVENGVITHME